MHRDRLQKQFLSKVFREFFYCSFILCLLYFSVEKYSQRYKKIVDLNEEFRVLTTEFMLGIF